MNIFIIGTDINIGKTFISAGLAALMQSLGYKTGIYKPFQTGAEDKNGFLMAPDVAYIKKIDAFIETSATYLMKSTAVPSLAAELEKINIDKNKILQEYKTLRSKCETTIVEGTGGLATPITSTLLMIDIVKLLDLPLIIVAKPDLDAINHTLLTINFAQQNGLDIRGVIINRYPQGTDDIAIRTLPRLIEEYSDTKVLGIVKDIDNEYDITPSVVIDNIINSIDVEKIFDIKIPKLSLD